MSALLYSSLNEENAPALSLSNRGLAYGDGIFETIRVVDGKVPLLDYHRARFLRGVDVLSLGDTLDLLSSFDQSLESAVQQLQLQGHQSGLVKLLAVRSEGGRGYAPADPAHAEIYIQVFESPHYLEAFYQQGIHLVLCAHRLSEQPMLAGIKHLNRIDQVLGARELGDAPEGLMLDQRGNVVEGTKSNLLVLSGEEIFTPELDLCGIRGTLLGALLAGEVDGLQVQEKKLSVDDLHNADGLIMINSVFGAWPVNAFQDANYVISDRVKTLMNTIKKRFGFSYEAA